MKHFFKLLVRNLGSKSDTHSNMLVTITNRDTNKNFHLTNFKKKNPNQFQPETLIELTENSFKGY